MVVPRLLIIVGTSGVGKSTMSARLASELGFSKVASTDTVREVLRTQLTSSDRPALHRSSFESAGGTPIEDWTETVEAVSEGVRAIIHRALEKRGDLLLEGAFREGPLLVLLVHVLFRVRDGRPEARHGHADVQVEIEDADRHPFAKELLAGRGRAEGSQSVLEVQHDVENLEGESARVDAANEPALAVAGRCVRGDFRRAVAIVALRLARTRRRRPGRRRRCVRGTKITFNEFSVRVTEGGTEYNQLLNFSDKVVAA